MTTSRSAPSEIDSVHCRTDLRRTQVRAHHRNGMDAVEVADDGLRLTVTFLGQAPGGLVPENFRIDGGRRIRGIRVVAVQAEPQEDPNLDDRVHLTVDKTGDHSTYTLAIVQRGADGYPGTQPYPGFDPRYAQVEFGFRQACPSELDCAEDPACPPVRHPAPAINYTARDYDSLRQLLLDRMTLTVPDWVERHAPDLGVTLVELLAYAGDQLSYYQDAVATEAYLDTARRRVSVRRHARLVDYAMHDGCNARTFVTMETDQTLTLDQGDYRFVAVDLSQLDPGQRPELGPVISDEDLELMPPGVAFEVFEPLVPEAVTLRPAHNEIGFWTWGEQECCLPKGATAATLRDQWIHHEDNEKRHPRRRAFRLRPGDVVIIEEVLGPGTGAPADADPQHRQAVRLTSVIQGVDDLYDQPVVEVTWEPEDALTFSVCLSARGGQDCCVIEDISVVRGNVVLVDHGRSLTACGGAPEPIVVPPASVRPPGCEPPQFGCPGVPDTDPAVTRLHELIGSTEDRDPLTEDNVLELEKLLGANAPARAGIVTTLDSSGRTVVRPDTVDEQHAALRTLLAQVTYPPLPGRFRPMLRYGPVTQRLPFPLPARVASGQSRLLAAIPERVRSRLTQLWRQVRDGRRLTADQVAELTVLFGERVLARLRLTEYPEPALRELLARHRELFATKLRRLEVLRTRVSHGAALDQGVAWELAQSWGEQYAAGLEPDSPTLAGSARSALTTNPRQALPAVSIREGDNSPLWTPRRDLLDSGPRDRHFVGEVEDSPTLTLRFGDGQRGAQPPAGATLEVSYRVGNGAAGNVGAEAVNLLALCCGAMQGGVTRVRNPLPATGGTEPETLNEVRQLAPLALRRQLLRAVTAADYVALASGVPGVQRAAAQFRWSGAAREVHVAIDPVGTDTPSPALIDAVTGELERVRRIGHHVVVGPARLVTLDIEISLCLASGYQRGHVLSALRAVLGNGTLPDGRLGFFHPDALSFGEPVRMSRLVAVAAAVPGVVTARVTRLRRQFGQEAGELDDGLLPLGPLEIARLDHDPSQPDHGRLTFVLGGGR